MKCTFILWSSFFFIWALIHMKESGLTTFWLASTNKSQILWIFINPCFWHQTLCWIIFLSNYFLDLEFTLKRMPRTHCTNREIWYLPVSSKEEAAWFAKSDHVQVSIRQNSALVSVCCVWFCIYYFVAEVNPLQPTLRIRFSYVVWSTGFASGAAKGLLY